MGVIFSVKGRAFISLGFLKPRQNLDDFLRSGKKHLVHSAADQARILIPIFLRLDRLKNVLVYR